MSFDDNLLNEVVAECQEHLSQMENLLLGLEEQPDQPDPDIINQLFRSAHSIKGVTGFCGLNNVRELAHNFENVLNAYRQNELKPTSSAVDVLLRATDFLKNLLDHAADSESYDIGPYVGALALILSPSEPSNRLTDTDTDRISDSTGTLSFAIEPGALQSEWNKGHYVYIVRLDADLSGGTPEDAIKRGLELVQSMGRIIATTCDMASGGIAQYSGRPIGLLFSTLIDPAMISIALEMPEDAIEEVSDQEFGMIQPAVSVATEPDQIPFSPEDDRLLRKETAPPVNEADRKDAPAAAEGNSGASSSFLRVNVALLDKLMNLAGELVLGRNQLLRTVSAAASPALVPVAQRIDLITSELQAEIMQTRMQPLAHLFGKFPRLVRDISRSLGKKIEIRIEGQEVELDKTIIEGLNDPLVHIIRNSLDHGIEKPDRRKSAGKNETGIIHVRAYHEAGQVNIEISDDGGGIDPEKLKAKAVKIGLLTTAEAQQMPTQKALELIFRPGFSTAEEVSEVSGRGVGMDVVRSNLERLSGTLDLQSSVGRGTTVRIKLPLTMAIIPCLIIRLGHERYAVPQTSLLELVRVKTSEIKDRIERVAGAEVLHLRDSLLPLVRLGEILTSPGWYRDAVTNCLKPDRRRALADRRSQEDQEVQEEWSGRRSGEDRRQAIDALNILVLSAGTLEYGLVVDELQDTEEIVVKPLGRHLKEIQSYAGATIMGDGRVAPILDVVGIAEQADLFRKGEEIQQAADNRLNRPLDDGRNDLEKVLLFTHGASEFFAVPITLVARIERIKTGSIESTLGRCSLQYRGQSLGLIKLDRHLPVEPFPELDMAFVIIFNIGGHETGLLASSLIDEKVVPFRLDTQTHRQPGIMGSMIIDSKTVMVIDVFELMDMEEPRLAPKTSSRQGRTAPLPKVLLVEDSDFFREKVAGYIRQAGYEVVTAANGREGLTILEQQSVDLVVTDIAMPVMDGYELVRHVRGNPDLRNLKVIALSSLAGDEDIARGRAVGVDQYLIKLDRQSLMETLSNILDGRQRRVASRS